MTENTTIEFTKAQLSAIKAAQDELEERVGNRPTKTQAVTLCCGRFAAGAVTAPPPGAELEIFSPDDGGE